MRDRSQQRAVALGLLLGTVAALSQAACTTRPDGWTDESHGEGAEPDYGTVFAQKVVNRLEIEIAVSDWEAMLDDMKTKYGPFGDAAAPDKGGPGGGGPSPPRLPPEMAQACTGQTEGQACTVSLAGQSLTGACHPMGPEELLCVPNDWASACADESDADACSLSMAGGTSVEGTCTVAGPATFCLPSKGPDGAGPPGGGPPGAGPPGGGDNGGPGAPDGEWKVNPTPIFVPCTLSFKGKTWRHVGVRFKGYSSLKRSWGAGVYKIPLRLDMDQLEDTHPEIKNQRLYGFKKLSLANNWSDDSLLRERVAADLFREAGVPAPMTAFVRVYVDHGQGPTYFGLYTMVEVPDEPMFRSQFEADGGNLYKPEGRGATWEKPTERSPFDEAAFEKKTNEQVKDWGDIKAAIAAVHGSQSDPVAWRTELERRFDVDGFVRWLAINTVMMNWDTYGRSPQNYYLYGDPGEGGRLQWIPWDNNMSLTATGGLFPPLALDLSTVPDQWPLISKLIADAVYARRYRAEVERFVERVFDPSAVKARLAREHDLIRPYVVGDEGEQPKHTFLRDGKEQAQFAGALADLARHVDDRASAALTFLESR